MQKRNRNTIRALSIATALSLSSTGLTVLPASAQENQTQAVMSVQSGGADDNGMQEQEATLSSLPETGRTEQPSGSGTDGQEIGSDKAAGNEEMDGTGMEDPGESSGDSAGFIEEPAAEPQDSGSGTASQEIDGTVTENTEPESTQEALFSADVSLKNPAAGNDGGIPGEGTASAKVDETDYDRAVEEAAAALKDALLDRKTELEVTFTENVLDGLKLAGDEEEKYRLFTDSSMDSDAQLKTARMAAEILLEACTHTGEPAEGDMLLMGFAGAGFSFNGTEEGGLTLSISGISYQDGADGEEKLEDISDEVLGGTGFSTMSDYAKAKHIYDWMYDNLSYSANGTAGAAAAADGERASSAGYAALGYYLFNRTGLDSRVILDGEEAYLIVRAGGQYYYLDPAGDSASEGKDSYRYFLKGSGTFSKGAEWMYTTDQFKAEFPVSAADYELSTVVLDETDIKVTVGTRFQLKAHSSGNKTLHYESSDEDIVQVNSSGQATAVSAGEAVITVTDGEGSATCTVYVSGEYELEVNAEGNVTQDVSGSGRYLEGDAVTITAIRETRDGYQFTSWEFSTEVEFLDGATEEDYRLSFYMPGEDVTATAVYEKVEAEDIFLDDTSIEMEVGDRKTLDYTLEPSNAFDGDVVFESSDEDVVTVSEDGELRAIGSGTATVTVSCGNAKAECKVTVKGEEYVIQVTGRTSSGLLTTQKKTVTGGQSMTISVPDVEDHGYRFTGWTSSVKLEYVDGYDENDIRTTFIMPDSDLQMTATYEEILPESISLEKTTISLNAGRTYSLVGEVTVEPDNAKKDDIKYESSDDTVAKVNEKGLITAVAEGTATITVSCGDAEASVKVTVNGKGTTASGAETLNITVSSIRMYAGRTYNLSVTKRNTGTVTYRSDNTSVATVNSSGVITGVSAGTCTITAVSESGKTSDTVKVTVVQRVTANESTTSTSSGLTDEQLMVFKSNAARYKADADKYRADALKAGYVADGTGLVNRQDGIENSGSSENTSEGGVVDVSSSGDSSVTVSGSESGTGEEGDSLRSTVSQPTGDRSHLGLWTILTGSLAALFISVYKALENRRQKVKENKRRWEDRDGN